MQSGYSQNGTSTPKIPYVITRSDFSKLYPVYQKMALALVQTGKVLIVDTIQPSVSSANPPLLSEQANNKPHLPPKGVPSYCMKSPIPVPGGSSCATPERARDVALSAGAEGAVPHQWGAALPPPTLGYYRLIRNGTPENDWKVVC
jgi:hypothetical protein